MDATARRIRIRGRVHGVGFRPFVWRLAHALGLTGEVHNDDEGVLIEAWGTPEALAHFQSRLVTEAPALASIEALESSDLDGGPADGSVPDDFIIAHSEAGPSTTETITEITPDVATCPDCLAELADPSGRRHGYPFTNCTQCGPRLSIVTGIPYDRANTTMAGFAMCPACRAEYDNPADRRFHAQPIACPVCGPKIWLEDADGPVASDDPLGAVVRRLRAGAIVAIKGIGGFHLACDATAPASVATLRARKHRPDKPFAVMARDVAMVRRYCRLGAEEAALLGTPAAPIVLLERLNDEAESGIAPDVAPGVAPGLRQLGVMLPYTPLHHLLMAALDRPIVLTSGNRSSAPQAIDNAEARRALAGIADLWLMHDRDIAMRLDDSVLRVDADGPVMLRRARGLAPDPVPLAADFAKAPPVLAMGGDMKAAFCLLTHGRAIPSPHLGELDDVTSFNAYRQLVTQFCTLYRSRPAVIAIDRHPDYAASRLGRALAEELGATLVPVQHHHAHLASCLAEHGVPPGADQAIGIVLDGTGYGADGTVWGGEILLGGYRGFTRRGHLATVPLPGAAQAVREPWRNLLAQLIAAYGADWRAALDGTAMMARLEGKGTAIIERMIEQQLNTPLTSSAGRLFDAVAAALGLCDRQSHEGQAAMRLEALAVPYLAGVEPYPVEIAMTDGVLVAQWRALWTALLDDLREGAAPGLIAARFHRGLITGLLAMTRQIAGDSDTTRVVLSGGVMQNRLLGSGLAQGLRAAGLDVLCQQRVPCNDGGLALGQAAIAACVTGG